MYALGLAINDKETRPGMRLRTAHDVADCPKLIELLDTRAESRRNVSHVRICLDPHQSSQGKVT